MKKLGKLNKGMPSAVLLSILVHAVLFLLAGMLVVFTVVKKEEKKFTPPKAVDRPKMKLKKPKVKVKKSARPKPAKHILAKVNPVNMPDIQLPEMSGMGGEGMGEGVVGGFDMMPDLSDTTLFGAKQSIGNDFEGTFYDFKMSRTGHKLSVNTSYKQGFRDSVREFLREDWKTSLFSRYSQSPRKLYSTYFIVPTTISSVAPSSFGEKEAVGAFWVIHYKGRLVCPASHTNGITFRFWGMADNFMAVRVGGKHVLIADFERGKEKIYETLWSSDSADSIKYYLGAARAIVGDWITLEPGESLDMEALFFDHWASVSCYLAIEEEGVEYERNRQGAPILPIFKTAELSHDQLDLIYKDLPEGEMICLTNGPVFCDYDTSSKKGSVETPEKVGTVVQEDTDTDKIRVWTLQSGRTVEAEFVKIFGDKIALKTTRGKIIKIPIEQLSAEDIEYAELESPPVLDINFLNSTNQKQYTGGFYSIWPRPSEKRGHYGVQLKQTSAGKYDHDLTVEMFVVGLQRGRKDAKYLILDRQEFTFNPAREEQRFFDFRSGREVVLNNYPDYYRSMIYGEKYAGYLVGVTDARGEIVAVGSSKKWLIDNLENLRKLSVGNYMDDTCTRTYPAQPGKSRWF